MIADPKTNVDEAYVINCKVEYSSARASNDDDGDGDDGDDGGGTWIHVEILINRLS